ncbi:torso-like protein [Macrosteles quadrilineatus]|uniref:torso-like protein n=1 Tax=Macrosteles quadrilineatus TaxID=74068 RepID=UPI0023E25244|nr:torso-like protein [Macrosteles quadrilineatus]XP_054265024.1 torso-like protein [Macrosteles quadrilineatus]
MLSPWSVLALTLLWLLSLTLSQADAQIRVGGAINLFGRYGYLSISMKVVPRNDTDQTWLFREPIVDVFKNVPVRNSLSQKVATNPIFQGDFHMEFCDNVRQLLQAYFRDFAVERLDRPWQAFTGSWGPAAVARNLGINSTYVTGRHSYVLVRLARHRDAARVQEDAAVTPDTSQIHEAVARQADQVKVGDTASVVEFIKSFGSHYVRSFVTGNSLFQVFVYSPAIYTRIKEVMKVRGVAQLSSEEINSYFSPWYAEHMGRILAASGNSTLESWATNNLRTQFYFFVFSSLIKLHHPDSSDLLKDLDKLLRNEALLQIDLRTLAPVFKDAQKRQWFEEVIDNNLKLWEVNMR